MRTTSPPRLPLIPPTPCTSYDSQTYPLSVLQTRRDCPQLLALVLTPHSTHPFLPGKRCCLLQVPAWTSLPPGSPLWSSALPRGSHSPLGFPHLSLALIVFPNLPVNTESPAHSAAQGHLTQLACPPFQNSFSPWLPVPSPESSSFCSLAAPSQFS